MIDTPNTARMIKNVSQSAAVKITGSARAYVCYIAPWLNTNTF
jgi:hypothetical protein